MDRTVGELKKIRKDVKAFLTEIGVGIDLGLLPTNPGACTGRWIEADGGDELVSVSPVDGEPLASVVQADEAAYEEVVAAAAEAFTEWRMMPAPARGEVVRELGNELRTVKEPLGKLVSLEMGKIKSEGLGEVQEMIDMCDFAVGLSRQLYGPTMMSERPLHRMYEQWHPLGVVGIITAFNFPVAVWAWNAALAAVCGDTMVWKPSSDTPLTAVAVQNICNRVMDRHGLHGIFNLLIGPGRTVGERMTQRPPDSAGLVHRLDRHGPSRGGGHCPALRTEHPRARRQQRHRGRARCRYGSRPASGVVRCGRHRRTAVHEPAPPVPPCQHRRRVHRQADQGLRQRSRIGDPLDNGVLMGPLVNERAVSDHFAAIDTIREQGGEVVCGGGAVEGPGFYVEPTIARLQRQIAIACDETFAPILYVMEYDDLDGVIATHNAVAQGLSSAIFTSNLYSAERFLSHRGSDCGIANVNIGTSGAEIGGAFGGEKETGGGREAGSDAWKAYMRRQTCTINWSKELPLAQGVEFDV